MILKKVSGRQQKHEKLPSMQREPLSFWILVKHVLWQNKEDQDEMPHLAAFHPGLHCLLR